MSIPITNIIRVKILDFFRKTNQLKVYREYLDNQFSYTKEEINLYQETKFNEIVKFHYNNNPTYRKFLEENGFRMKENVTVESVPIISKEFFRQNKGYHSVRKEIAKTKHSSGSTGTPLTYHLSKSSLEGQWPSLWRAFELYDIKPCDKLMMIAGHSLFNNRTFKRRLYDSLNNFIVVPAFDLTDEALEKAYRTILKENISAIYAYTSGVLLFLQFLQKKGYKLHLKAIFTTAELFNPYVRPLAKEYCDCEVIDTYGANDGGIQAFECPYHEGYHLNFERCFVEIINGEIILTDLLNKATPFIRYRVGDCTTGKSVIKDPCKCGRTLFRLSDVSGRINHYIKDIDYNIVHTAFFNQLFASDQHIRQFQVIQKKNQISVNIVHDNTLRDQVFLKKYQPLINKRIKMPCEIIFNQPIYKLPNMKVPVFWKEETNTL